MDVFETLVARGVGTVKAIRARRPTRWERVGVSEREDDESTDVRSESAIPADFGYDANGDAREPPIPVSVQEELGVAPSSKETGDSRPWSYPRSSKPERADAAPEGAGVGAPDHPPSSLGALADSERSGSPSSSGQAQNGAPEPQDQPMPFDAADFLELLRLPDRDEPPETPIAPPPLPLAKPEEPMADRTGPGIEPLQTSVEIRIGRLEIRAPAKAQRAASSPRPRGPRVSLGDYLGRRKGA